ncbi:uncharacterized protein [Physcomitrium patens]|uniref:uncharacterized protein isoform X2 n=1 Tax=Physcomitrium patens TaxID=3218 RepID=UPI000D175D76|nr:uncharacterized protein C9.08c-like isoform X2 [Physcomitrium patens]|eukprot:XP_024365007.1 uncharacterized protein C9.08c-like isoform X2 [Physcomitrella patens]
MACTVKHWSTSPSIHSSPPPAFEHISTTAFSQQHVQPLKQPRFSVSRSSTYRSSLFSVPTVRGQRSGGFIRGFEVGSSGVRSRRVSLTMAALPGLFPHADSIVVKTMEFLLAFSGPLQMYNEATGKNMGYAKFASALGKDNKAMVPSRVGMLSIYIVAAGLASVFLAYAVGFLPLSSLLESIGASGAASFLDQAVAASDDRLLLVAAALSVHFVKRSVEVLFLHRFSGSMSVGDAVTISTSYSLQVVLLLYSQLLSADIEAPSPDTKYLGVAVFLIGLTGNFYHHWILANLRKDGQKKYVVPHGGLFGLFVCPHYVFEVIDFVGMALISQTVYGWCMVSFATLYLTGRGIATKNWYKKNVDGFPQQRSVILPGIF